MEDLEPADPETQLHKDVTYSPGSENETEERQQSPDRSSATDDIDADAVQTLPGTGGPDDNGAVDVAEDEIHIPRDSGAH